MKTKSLFRAVLLAAMCLWATGLKAQPFAVMDTIGQRYQRYSTYCSPEKVFLHLDRTYYAIDETIYFMGYLDNADRLSVLPPSNFIYVELLGPDGKSEIRVKVKRDKNGGFPGQMYLPEDLRTGRYILRAYTLWQVNMPPEYLFHEEVNILGIGEAKHPQKDPTDDDVDVTFYPEGGRYFAGHLSVIAFKVLNPKGKCVDITGTLVDSKGEPLIRVTTFHDGMGYFSFIPEEGETYTLKVDGGGEFRIPDPSEDGVTINMGKNPKSIIASVYGPSHGSYCLFARDASGISFLGKVKVSESDRNVKINRKEFNPGINHLILTDAEGHIVAERLFYVYEDPAKVPVCKFRTTASIRKPEARELIKTQTILTEGDGVTPVDGTFSFSVVRGNFAPFSQKDDIVSYMKLSSELKGRINNPGYYFDSNIPEVQRNTMLDLLMMVQGWRYYDIDRIFADDGYSRSVKHSKEYVQRVTGVINNPYSDKIPHKFSFTVFAPKLHAVVAEGVQESRRFLLDSLDFEDGTGFFIKIGRDKGVNNYQPKWDGDVFAQQFKYNDTPGRHFRFTPMPQEVVPVSMDGSMVDTIEAAVVSVKAEYDPFLDNNKGWEKNASDLETYSEQTLLEYLQFKQSSFVYDDGEGKMTNKYAESATFNESGSSGLGTVKLIVDDTEEEWWMFDDLKLEDIDKITISSHPNTYYNANGGIVSIKLVSGKTLSKVSKKDPTLTYFVPLGYQKPSRFYNPRYDKGDVYEGFDKRSTICWHSAVNTEGGKAGVFFSNTDQMDYPYIVHIEGRTKDGRWFSYHGKICE